MWQPTPAFLKSLKRESRYTQKREGERIAPCLTPFLTEKASLSMEFHLIKQDWFWYMETKSLRNTAGKSLSLSFMNRELKFTLSNAFEKSNKQQKTFDSLLK